ncbi:unnamed protein product [Adineta steineri]|uniref:Fork-head domain-containing protein n=1 Tax=Adineta steineri TaxID=433720 RepID=A0A814LJ10_9BILA|nr:unnamed protein product [Adineta steineri]CAF3736519.1 unnamed protein product [Adineta steineri]
MTQWPIQRNIYTLVPQINPMNKINSQETPHVLTTHNTNTPRISLTTNHHISQQQQQQTTTFNAFDDSLTNLSWLHDINILKRTMPAINSSSSSSSSVATNNKRKERPSSSCISSSPLNSTIYPNDISDNNELPITHDDDSDEQWRMYKTNPQAKPVYSYSQLILLAMKQSGYEKMTLQMIYEWVAENFPYFKKMEPTWQNSIRHNLSLNKCFIKVPRTKKEAGGGKGGFWKLSPDYERQRSLAHTQQQQQELNSPSNKRKRHSKRSTSNQFLSNKISSNSTRISHENIKTESWIDPILPCIVSKSQSPLHCHTTIVDRSYTRMPSSFLSPTSSPDSLIVSPFNPHHIHDFSSILTPSPSSSPSSVISKQNFHGTKLDDTDMLLLDTSTFDWDAYLCETPSDIDVHPLLSTKTEQDLFNDFNAALTDLTSSAEAAAAAGADTNAFDAFDYPSKHSTFNCLFDDDDQSQQQQQQQISEPPSNPECLTVKGCSIKRPSWWITDESVIPTKLPSLETAFDLKLSK